ncbi:hypothetical protein GCM10010182_45800 [Actinomadura cremea]|nr:hypothetical protein GCM10010182_45800 [Actinomadura cremea]
MGLSWREEILLRRIDACLEKDDPPLARRLTTFASVEAEPTASWRPSRAAVVIVAVALAVAVFLMALVVLSVEPPCRGAGTAVPSGAPPQARPAAADSSPRC